MPDKKARQQYQRCFQSKATIQRLLNKNLYLMTFLRQQSFDLFVSTTQLLQLHLYFGMMSYSVESSLIALAADITKPKGQMTDADKDRVATHLHFHTKYATLRPLPTMLTPVLH